MNSVIYRYKHRVSLYVYQKNNEFVRIDLTLVKMNKLINRLDRSAPRYELEMEYGQSTDQNKKPSKELFNLMIKESDVLLKVFQQSNFIISKTEAQHVLDV